MSAEQLSFPEGLLSAQPERVRGAYFDNSAKVYLTDEPFHVVLYATAQFAE